MTFQEKLISLRKAKGLSQEELGAELHVSRQTVKMGIRAILSGLSAPGAAQRLF